MADFGWDDGTGRRADNYYLINSRVINYLLAPYAAELATRYQNYTHVYIDPFNEPTYGQWGVWAVALQRAIYNSVKGALPFGKKDNIKVMLGSQFWGENIANDLPSMISAVGSERIYDEYAVGHIYANTNTFDLNSKVAAVRNLLDSYGRTDVKIQIGEFGMSGGSGPADTFAAAAIPNMLSEASATGLVDSVLYWPQLQPALPDLHAFLAMALWDYKSFNKTALPNPFTYGADYEAIAALNLTPLLPIVSADSAVTDSASSVVSGVRQSGLVIQGVSGGVFGAVTYPTSTTWIVSVSGLTAGDNTITVQAVNGSTVVGTALANIFYEVPAPGSFSVPGISLQPLIAPVSLSGQLVGKITASAISLQPVVVPPTLSGAASGQFNSLGLFLRPTVSAPTLTGIQRGSFQMPSITVSAEISPPTLSSLQVGSFTLPEVHLAPEISVPTLTGVMVSGSTIRAPSGRIKSLLTIYGQTIYRKRIS